jgi:GH18 family chitinase
MSDLIKSMDLFTKDERWKADPRKLNFGIPFYGYEFDGARVFGEKFKTCKDLGYSRIEQFLKKPGNDGWKKSHDPEPSGAPYLVKENPDALITYDDAVSIRSKVEAIRERHMGGVFVWRLGHDFDKITGKQPLLDALIGAYAEFLKSK